MNKLEHINITSFYQFLDLFEKYDRKDALWTSDESIKLSYRELRSEIKNFSYSLSKIVKPGQRVVLLDLHGPHWVITFFSIILNKAIAVPIDSRMNKELQDEIIKMVGAKLIITCTHEGHPKLEKIVYENTKSLNRSWRPQEINPDLPAEIIFTSGTWGKPKGVILTHNNLLSNLNSVLKVYRVKEGEKLLSVLPLSHAYEQMCGLFVPLASGCHIIYQEALDSFSLIESLQKFKVDYMVVVPKFLELLQNSILRSLGRYDKIFRSLIKTSEFLPISKKRLVFRSLHKKFGGILKTFIVGGAPLANKLEDFFRNIGFNIIVGYGLSESSPVLAVSQENRRPNNSVGYPIPEVVIKIQEDSEIIASGPNISPGYWPLEQKVLNGVLSTGDLGYLDKKGRLIITGRKKNMVVFSTGDKIQLEDIEDVASQFPGIIETCAVSVYKNDGNHKFGIVYVGDCKTEDLISYVNSKLPLYARIQFAQKWSESKLPRSHTLKLQRDVINKGL